jgi:hypothetical protein
MPTIPASTPTITRVSLRTAQIRILLALFKARGPLSRRRICEAVAEDYPTARNFQSWITAPLGSVDEDRRSNREDDEGYPSLLSLNMAGTKVLDIDGKSERVFFITEKGRQALASLIDTTKVQKD